MTTAKRLATVVFVVFVLLALPQPARAKTVNVGNGTPASCTEAALRNALTFAGGEKSSVIQFRCGAGPVTIAVTAMLTVPDNTTIDGGGMITLDGQFQLGTPGPILRVDRENTVTLKNLTIQRGVGCFTCQVPGGGGIHNEGTLTVRGCTFSGNSVFIFGGGIFNQGTLTVHDSAFSGNRASSAGGAIFSQGTLAVHGSTFTGNGSLFGAAIFAEGTLTVHDSAFDGNGNGAVASGGALFSQGTLAIHGSAFDGNGVAQSPLGPVGTPSGAIDLGIGTHKISHSTITRNTAEENGAGINLTAGTLTVVDSTITQNRTAFGGGIHVHPLGGRAATLAVKNSTISENIGFFDGGGISNHGGAVTIDDSTITRNHGGSGGGIANGGTLAVKDSTISENTAGTFGGGIYNANLSPGATQTVKDSTITQNTAGFDGGGIYGVRPILTNTFVTNNTPDDIAP